MKARTTPEQRETLDAFCAEFAAENLPAMPVTVSVLAAILADLAEAEAEQESLTIALMLRAARIERVRALHYEADNTPSREPVCDQCHGKAGVHGCGCWADEDREPICGCCRGTRGASVPWPCPTIRALDGEG